MEKREVVGYVRISGDGQDLESQKYELRRFLIKLKYYKEPLWFEDQISGATKSRPGLNSLKEYLKKHPGTLVVTIALDRISRAGFLPFAEFEAFVKKVDCQIKYANYQETGNEEIDEISKFFMATQAKRERANIKERTQRGKASLLAIGSYSHGGNPPYGYQYKIISSHHNITKRDMIINESEEIVVRQIFDLFLNKRMAVKQICRYLDAKGIKRPGRNFSKKVRNQWSDTAVRGILKNTVYIGEWKCNKRFTIKVGDKTKRIARQPDDPNIVRLKSPKIISKKDFDRASRLLNKRAKIWGINSPHKREYLLRGILKCGLCKYSYSGTSGSTLRKNAYYRCGSIAHVIKRGKRGCGNVTLKVANIDNLVIKELKKALSSPEHFIKLLKDVRLRDQNSTRGIKLRIGEAREAEEELKQAKDRLLDGFSRGIIPEEDYLLRLKTYNQDLTNLKIRRQDMEDEIQILGIGKNIKVDIEKLKKECDAIMKKAFKKADEARKKEWDFNDKLALVRRYIETVTVFPNKVEIKFNIPKVKTAVVATNNPTRQVFEDNNLYFVHIVPITPAHYVFNTCLGGTGVQPQTHIVTA